MCLDALLVKYSLDITACKGTAPTLAKLFVYLGWRMWTCDYKNETKALIKSLAKSFTACVAVPLHYLDL